MEPIVFSTLVLFCIVLCEPLISGTNFKDCKRKIDFGNRTKGSYEYL